MDDKKRKLTGYVTDNEIKLLENAGLLSSGRGSKFSEWLRTTINEYFGNRDGLRNELKILKLNLSRTEIEKANKDQEIINITEKMQEIEKIFDKERIIQEKLEKYSLNQNQFNIIKDIRLQFAKNPKLSLISKFKTYRENFKSFKFEDFNKLIKITE